jgi:hypothetical protein
MTDADLAAGYREALEDIVDLIASCANLEAATMLSTIEKTARRRLAGEFPVRGLELAGEEGKCRSCGADVIWIRTKAGKAMPCNPKRYVITTAAGDSISGYVSHFANCPRAREHRRK